MAGTMVILSSSITLVTPCKGPFLDISGRKMTVDIATFNSDKIVGIGRVSFAAQHIPTFTASCLRLVRLAKHRSVTSRTYTLHKDLSIRCYPGDWVGMVDYRRCAGPIH